MFKIRFVLKYLLSIVAYGPTYGSYDTVGCGVTSNGRVYFTKNGLLLPIIPDFKLKGDIFAVVYVRGAVSHIYGNFGRYSFDYNSEKVQGLVANNHSTVLPRPINVLHTLGALPYVQQVQKEMEDEAEVVLSTTLCANICEAE